MKKVDAVSEVPVPNGILKHHHDNSSDEENRVEDQVVHVDETQKGIFLADNLDFKIDILISKIS